MIFRKFALLLLLVITASCSELESCYYAEDFGNVGNRDQLNVAAQFLSCHYDSSLEINASTQSVDIVECLKETKVSTANSGCDSDEVCKTISNNFCSTIDPITNKNYSTTLFQNCLSYCSNKCEEDSTGADESHWIKAELKKSNTSYYGLKIDSTSFITIQATGRVSLSEATQNKSSKYKKVGINETDYSLIIKPTDTYSLKLQYNSDTLSTLLKDNIDNIKSRTILSIKNIEPSIVDSRENISNEEKYKFQEPLFQYISCSNVKDKNYFGINELGGCFLNYSSNSDINSNFALNLNSYYNDINTILFKNGTYYNYAADILNNVNYMTQDSSSGLYVPVFEKKDTSNPDLLKLSTDGMRILYNNSTEDLAAYLWNNNNNSFRISYNDPFKVAIRYIGNSSATCNYTASIDRYYEVTETIDKEGVSTNTITHGTKVYNIDNLEFKAAGKEEGNKNTWYVLKTQVGTNGEYREIVFNQFSNSKNKQTTLFTLTTENEDCNKGLLIYIIPLKDYTPYYTGLLYFYLPNNSSQYDISYSIINPQILNVDSASLKKQEIKLEEYYEDTTGYNVFGLINTNEYKYKTLKTITLDDVLKIDNNKYNSTIVNSDFIRDNQIIRFDYKNWFDIDGKTTISKKTLNYNGMIVDRAAIFNVIIKKQYPFMCFGEAKEIMDSFSYCSNKNLAFKQVTVSKQCFANDINSFVSLPSNLQNTAPTPAQLTNDINSFVSLPSNCLDVNKNTDFCSTTKDLVSKCYVGNFKPTGSDKTLADFYVDLKYSDLVGTQAENDFIKETTKNSIVEGSVADFVSDAVFSIGSSLYNVEDSYVVDEETIIVGKSKNTAEIEKFINYSYQLARECVTELINKDNIRVVKDIVVGNNTYKISYDMSKIKSVDELLPEVKKVDTGFSTHNIISLTTQEKYNNMINLFLTKIVNEVKESNVSYSNTFNMYTIINQDSLKSNRCQCYDLTDFVGSTKQFFRNIKTNNNIVDISNYGLADENYVNLGIKKVSNFTTNSAGNITNFIADTEFNNWHNNLNCQGNCVALGYDNQISSSTQYTISLNILNSQVDYDNIVNYFSNNTYNDVLYATNDSIKEYNSNGDRLSVILGEDSMNYVGDIKDDLNNDLKGYNSTSSVLNITQFDNNSTTSSMKYYPLVYYPEKITTESSYYFNDDGLLTDRNNVSAIDVKNNQLISKYITSDSIQKNIFFKISDVDNNSSNNSGKYLITIKEYVENDYDSMIDMFRLFFQSVLSFVDGNSISLLLIGDSSQEILNRFVRCEKPENDLEVSCHVYSPGSEDNGKICSPKDLNCFVDCLGQGDGACFKFNDGKGFIKNVYKTIVTNPLYILLLKIALILSIALYGFGYFFGLTSFKQSEIIGKIIKLCFVYFMASASGWEFFDKFIATFFKDGVDSILFLIASSFEADLSSEVMQAVATKNYSDKIVLFSGAMDNLELLISMPVFSKIVGLFFSGWIGPVYFYFVMTTLLTYIVAVISSIIIYLSIQIYMSLVFCFFPLVIIFMLFKKSENTFKNWLSILIGFAGQQILLITTLSFFNMLIYNFIKSTFAYTVCWLPLLDINIGGFPIGVISFYKVPNTGISTIGINAGNEAMPSFYSIITFYMVGALMGKFITSMTSLGNSIFGGKFNVTDGKSLTSSAIGIAQGLKGKADDFMKSTGQEWYSKLGRLGGGSFIEREGNKKLQERRAKEEKFNDELDKRTAKSLKSKRETNEYKQKTNNITNMARNKATAEEFANDEEFMKKYKKALNGKEDDGTNEEANKLVNEKLSSDSVTNKQRNSIGKSANSIQKNEMRKLNKEMEKETRAEESRKMLTETNDDGKPGEFNIINQISSDKNEKDHMESRLSGLGSDNLAEIASIYSRAHGYDQTEKDKSSKEDTNTPESGQGSGTSANSSIGRNDPNEQAPNAGSNGQGTQPSAQPNEQASNADSNGQGDQSNGEPNR